MYTQVRTCIVEKSLRINKRVYTLIRNGRVGKREYFLQNAYKNSQIFKFMIWKLQSQNYHNLEAEIQTVKHLVLVIGHV